MGGCMLHAACGYQVRVPADARSRKPRVCACLCGSSAPGARLEHLVRLHDELLAQQRARHARGADHAQVVKAALRTQPGRGRSKSGQVAGRSNMHPRLDWSLAAAAAAAWLHVLAALAVMRLPFAPQALHTFVVVVHVRAGQARAARCLATASTLASHTDLEELLVC